MPASRVVASRVVAPREPLTSDRPDFTESTSIVQPGDVQAEGGYTFARSAGEKSSSAGELLLRIGVTRFDPQLGEPGSYSWVTSQSGTESGREDGEVGAKLRLYEAAGDDPSPVPNVAVVVKSSVPTGGAVFRESRLQPEVELATEWTLASHVGLGTNLDLGRPVADGRRYTELAASASFGFDLSRRVGAFADYFPGGRRRTALVKLDISRRE